MRFLIEIFVASRRVFSGAVSFFCVRRSKKAEDFLRRASADTTYTEKENYSSLFLGMRRFKSPGLFTSVNRGVAI